MGTLELPLGIPLSVMETPWCFTVILVLVGRNVLPLPNITDSSGSVSTGAWRKVSILNDGAIMIGTRENITNCILLNMTNRFSTGWWPYGNTHFAKDLKIARFFGPFQYV
jgi:hypothetical protein